MAWRQRSRDLWLKQGDKNTKYFHRTANAHRRYNNIDKLIVEGETMENPTDIKEEIVTFYQKLYSEPEIWRPHGNIINCPRISPEENLICKVLLKLRRFGKV